MKESLKELTVLELRSKAKELKLEGYTVLNKDDLIELIADASGLNSVALKEVKESKKVRSETKNIARKFLKFK